jgi:hypothetical protein
MKTLLNPWFITGCITWAIVIAFRKLGHPIPYINGHLTDAFAIPVIANLGLWFKRVVIIKNDYYILSKKQVAFVVIYVSVFFELLLPYLSNTYTADWIDVLLYIAGGVFFYQVMNKPVVDARNY